MAAQYCETPTGYDCSCGYRSAKLTYNRFLDIAIICEYKGDIQMARVAATKAVEVKRNCQGTDFPNFYRYEEVLRLVQPKIKKGRR